MREQRRWSKFARPWDDLARVWSPSPPGNGREILWTVWGDEGHVRGQLTAAGATVRGVEALTFEEAAVPLLSRVVLGIIVAALVALSVWGIVTATPPTHSSNETLMMFSFLVVPFLPIGALWPLGVWRQEPPEGCGYFWSLPARPAQGIRSRASWPGGGS